MTWYREKKKKKKNNREKSGRTYCGVSPYASKMRNVVGREQSLCVKTTKSEAVFLEAVNLCYGFRVQNPPTHEHTSRFHAPRPPLSMHPGRRSENPQTAF